MAKVSFNIPIEKMTGALDSKHKFIQRQKHLHDTYGFVTRTCEIEGYMRTRPRNYKHNRVLRPLTSSSRVSTTFERVSRSNCEAKPTRKPLSTNPVNLSTITASTTLSAP